MTAAHLQRLRAKIEAEPAGPVRRVMELAAEALAAELECDLPGAVAAEIQAHPAEAARCRVDHKLVGFFIGKVRARAGGGDPGRIRELVLGAVSEIR